MTTKINTRNGRLFDTSNAAGLKAAEQYKDRLNGQYERVTVTSEGLFRVRITGYNPITKPTARIRARKDRPEPKLPEGQAKAREADQQATWKAGYGWLAPYAGGEVGPAEIRWLKDNPDQGVIWLGWENLADVEDETGYTEQREMWSAGTTDATTATIAVGVKCCSRTFETVKQANTHEYHHAARKAQWHIDRAGSVGSRAAAVRWAEISDQAAKDAADTANAGFTGGDDSSTEGV